MAVAVDLKGVVKHLVDGTLHRNLCRICLLPLGVASENVFTKICKDDLEYSVADILGTVCQIKFSDSDNFNVCPECFKMAFNAYKLFMVAKRSEEILNYYVEELDRNVHAIETMREYHDSLCITFPDFSPPIEYIDFNIDQFLENRTVHTEPETEKEEVDPKPQPESLLKKKPETKLSKLDDEEFIIVVMGDSKTQSQPCKIKDGKVVILPTEKPEENIPEILPKKKRRKREPMMTRTCSRCPVKYSFLSKLQMHMKVEHNVDLYVCKICKAIFESNQEYNIHLGTHLDVHQCNYCNLTFKKRESIIAHLKMHEDMKNSDSNLNICELCGTILASDELLSEHFEKKHIKKYTCYYCGKMYKGELSFETHIKKHEKMMNSADKKQPPGAAAGSAYARARRRLVCAACGKDFVDERALLWHSMLHTDERPYTCDTCGRGFVSLNRRNQHALCAHSRPTRRCPLCPALFHLRSMVNTHIKKVHLKAHKRRNRTSKHYNVCWKTEAVPIQELSVSIQNEILELQTRVPEEEDYAVPGTSDYIPLEWDGK